MPNRQKRDTTVKTATAKELKALSVITASDVARADQEWRRVAPKEFSEILDAVEEK